MSEYEYDVFDEFSYFWDDPSISKRIESIVIEAESKYNISLGEQCTHFCFNILYGQLFAGDSNPNRYTNADSLLKLLSLKRGVIVKDKIFKTEFEISEELIKIIKGLIQPIASGVLNWGELIGLSQEEKYDKISELSKEKTESFKITLNNCIRFLKGWDIFSNELITIGNKEAAFLYDIFYQIKHELNANLPINWGDSPDVASNADKRRVILKLMDK